MKYAYGEAGGFDAWLEELPAVRVHAASTGEAYQALKAAVRAAEPKVRKVRAA